MNPANSNQNRIDSPKIPMYNPKILPDYDILGISNLLNEVNFLTSQHSILQKKTPPKLMKGV